jgi:hypothetical protein
MMAAERSGSAVAAGRWPRWYFLVPLVIFVSFGTFRRLTDAGVDAELKLKFLIWLVLGTLALLLWRRILQGSYLLFRPPLLFCVAFWLLAMLSTVYSGTPGFTLFRASQLGILIALGIVAADRIERWPTLAMMFLAINWAFLLVGLTGYPATLHWRLLPAFQEPSFAAVEDTTWRFGTPMVHFSDIGIIAATVAVASVARLKRAPSLGELCILSLRADVVGVHASDELGRNLRQREVEGSAQAAPSAIGEDAKTRVADRAQIVDGAVCRSIVDRQDDEIAEGLRLQARDRRGQVGHGVEHGHEDGEPRRA